MTVVFVHGAGGGAWEWGIWQRIFAAHGAHCAAIELAPAAGGLARTSLEDYLGQLRGFAQAEYARMRDAPLVLVGASLGGLLALACADALAVHALVLVNPIPPAPFHLRLPRRAARGDVIPWGREATLQGTRRAIPDADDAACRYAFRRWRDESGAVLDAAYAGLEVPPPRCPIRVVASTADDDVPCEVSAALAGEWRAAFVVVEAASHVGPVFARCASATARETVSWLSQLHGSRRAGPHA